MGPRNIRNFWIDLTVDGKAEPIATGPRGRDGGFSLTIRQRDKGEITLPIRIEGMVREDGKLCLYVISQENCVFEHETER